MVLQIFKRLRLRRAEDPASYRLLGDGLDHFEKQDDEGISDCDGDRYVASIRTHIIPKRDICSWRWLRKLQVLLPSFLHTSTGQVEPKKLRPTAWLDGLRGIAALFVVLHHMSLIWFPWSIHDGWASRDDHLIQLPIIRLAVSGPANVMVFFVVSGYALSLKPLRLLREGRHLEMYRGLASAVFRRHPRLFIPAFVICLPAPAIAYLGGYGRAEGGSSSSSGMPGAAIRPMSPPRLATPWAQLGHYATTLAGLADVYEPRGLDWAYSDSLWTLPVEFRGSLVVFTLLLALSGCAPAARVAVTLGVAAYSFWCFHWGEFLFVGGMLVVEWSLRTRGSAGAGEAARGRSPLPRPWPLSRRRWWRASRRPCAVAAFAAALFVLGMPEQGRGAARSYGFATLSGAIPARFQAAGAGDYFWTPMAAVGLVAVVDGARCLQGVFTTRAAQYLGRVSFALYLVHMLVLHSLGFWLGDRLVRITGSETYWRYGAGVGLAAVAVGCVIVWAADLASRFVDAKTVRFTAWVYEKLCEPRIGG